MSIPSRMRVVAHAAGEPLQIVEVPTPRPAAGEILIRVAAAGVNRPDLLQRDGLYPPPPGAPTTLGLEVAGEVVGLGEGAGRWKTGDWVTALLPGGGYAEYAVAADKSTLPMPKGFSPVEAAALPEAVFTCWANLFEHGALKPSETVLLHGGASGIGTTALQMARAGKAKPIVVVRSEAKAAVLRERLKAKDVIDSSALDFEAVVRELGGADVVLDMIGAPLLQKNLNVLKEGGRLVIIGFMQGAAGDINLTRLLLKRLTITGSTLRSRSREEKARLAAEVEKNVWPWINNGKIKPIVDRVFPLADAEAAHAHMRGGAHIGKIVLVMH